MVPFGTNGEIATAGQMYEQADVLGVRPDI